MPRLHLLILALIAACPLGCRTSDSGAGVPVASFVQHADSADSRKYTATNQRFLFVGERSTDTSVLILETQAVSCCRQAELSTQSRFTVRGWRGVTDTKRAPDWTVSLEADEGGLADASLFDPFYVATIRGCCDAGNLLTFVDIRTGELRFRGTSTRGSPALAEAFDHRNQASRYASFHDRSTLEDPAEATAGRDVVGVLQYGSATGPVKRVTLLRTSGPGNDYSLKDVQLANEGEKTAPQIQVGNSPVTHSLAEGFTNFSIVVTVWGIDIDPVEIRVPVRGDSLDIAAAVLPAGFALR